MVAVCIQPAVPADKEARGRILLRIQAHHLHAIPGHKRQKGDEVPLVHGMVKRDWSSVTYHSVSIFSAWMACASSGSSASSGGRDTPQQEYAPSPTDQITLPHTGQT